MESGAKAYQEGCYETAETMFLAARKEAEALNLKEAEAVSPGDKRLASTLHQLAQVYYAEESYEKAEPLFKDALATWDKPRVPETTDVANCLSYLAMIEAENDHLAAAQTLYERSLSMKETIHGRDHPDIVTPLTT